MFAKQNPLGLSFNESPYNIDMIHRALFPSRESMLMQYPNFFGETPQQGNNLFGYMQPGANQLASMTPGLESFQEQTPLTARPRAGMAARNLPGRQVQNLYARYANQ